MLSFAGLLNWIWWRAGKVCSALSAPRLVDTQLCGIVVVYSTTSWREGNFSSATRLIDSQLGKLVVLDFMAGRRGVLSAPRLADTPLLPNMLFRTAQDPPRAIK